MGNNEFIKRGYYILEKENIFLDQFNKILGKLNFSEIIYDDFSLVKQRTNQIDHFKNSRFDIDIIYSSDKIIVIVRAEQDNLEKFKSLILSYSQLQYAD